MGVLQNRRMIPLPRFDYRRRRYGSQSGLDPVLFLEDLHYLTDNLPAEVMCSWWIILDGQAIANSSFSCDGELRCEAFSDLLGERLVLRLANTDWF